jgi:hypothetical protein
MAFKRTVIQQAVAEELISSGAINMDAMAKVLATHGPKAVLNGDSIGCIIGPWIIDWCIPVDFKDLIRGIDVRQELGGLNRG